jgi:Tol biopolymer transport system component
MSAWSGIPLPLTTLVVAAVSLLMDEAANRERRLAAVQDSSSKIVFVSDRNGRDAPDEIYIMNADGTDPRRVTVSTSGNNLFPRWSADGKRIAFMSNRDGTPQIYVIDADGTGLKQLITVSGAWPVWSPDGRRIAFVARSASTSGAGEIMIVNPDGTGLTQLTHNGAVVGHLDWSPDGAKIAFVTNRDGNAEIYVMNADGTTPVRLTVNTAGDNGPRWSPDGRTIAFMSDRDGNLEIYVMSADGTEQRRRTTDPRLDAWPSWSPDGRRLAFMRQIEIVPGLRSPNGSDILEMNADGSELTRVTHTAPAAFSAFPDWGPRPSSPP